MYALFAFAPAARAAAGESRTVLTLKSDGSCVIRSDLTQPRSTLEQQTRMRERMKRMSEGAAEDEDVPPPPVGEKDTKPMTDAELKKSLQDLMEEQQEQRVQPGEMKLESIDVNSNSVRMVTTHTFGSLEEALRNPYMIWGQSGLMFESLRFEKETAGNLRITFTPYSGNPRWTKNSKQTWKANKVNAELRLVLPGKVLTSGLPNTDGNATWIAIDGTKDETLAAAIKLYDAPTVITAELAGLKLDSPLDSKTLQRHPGQRTAAEPNLPLTDAGPGFSAEPLSVAVTTLHWFADGQKLLKNAGSVFGSQPTGAVVQAKLFAPKGRTLQSVTDVRVLKAVDDKGRSLAVAPDDDSNSMMGSSYSVGRGGNPNSQQIQMRLPLPAADAQSIERLDAEAIAVTVGNWKEMPIAQAAATSTNEIDLANVLPGAKLVITKVTSKNGQKTVQGRFTGPPAIRQLEFKLRDGGDGNANSYMNERGFKTKGAESTRNFVMQTSRTSSEDPGTLSFVVRFPEDQKRERVRFSLKGLDLL